MHDGTQRVYRWRIAPADVEAERQRFRAAVNPASRRVLAIKEQAEKRFGEDHASSSTHTCFCWRMRSLLATWSAILLLNM